MSLIEVGGSLRKNGGDTKSKTLYFDGTYYAASRVLIAIDSADKKEYFTLEPNRAEINRGSFFAE